MSKYCRMCGKGYLKANLVPRGIGRRVTNRSITRKQVNLQSKRFMVDGTSIRLVICTSCLKRLNYEDRLLHQHAAQVSSKGASSVASVARSH